MVNRTDLGYIVVEHSLVDGPKGGGELFVFVSESLDTGNKRRVRIETSRETFRPSDTTIGLNFSSLLCLDSVHRPSSQSC